MWSFDGLGFDLIGHCCRVESRSGHIKSPNMRSNSAPPTLNALPRSCRSTPATSPKSPWLDCCPHGLAALIQSVVGIARERPNAASDYDVIAGPGRTASTKASIDS